MAEKFYFLGTNVYVTSSVTDNNDVPITPSTVGVVVTDPTGAAVTVGTPTVVSTGNYKARVAAATVAGSYNVIWTYTVSGDTATDEYTYTVLSTIPVVSTSDLGAYLGITVDDDRATLLLSVAQQLCESIVSPLPNGAAAVVLDVAARGYSNPGNAQQQTEGPFSVSYGAISGGLWLTNQNKATLRRLAGQVGAFTIDTMPATAGQGLPWWDAGNIVIDNDYDQIPT